MLAFLRNHWSRHLVITLFVFSAICLALCLLSGLGHWLHIQELTGHEAGADEKLGAGERAIERLNYGDARKLLGDAIATYRELMIEWGKMKDRAIGSWVTNPQRPRPDFPGDRVSLYEETKWRVELKLAKALAKRGFASFHEGDYSNAIADLDETIKLDSKNPQAYE